MKIINPFNETIIQEIQEDTAESISNKFDKVKAGQKTWASVPLIDRIQCFVRFNQLLEEKKDKLAADLTNEMGNRTTKSTERKAG
jgi:acyl-CoA reductase-like NAD-dependent aldehyde dehydrogenase